MEFRVLCLGDVVGERSVAALRRRLPEMRREWQVDFVTVNGENAHAGAGNGLCPDEAEDLLDAGADVITGGNHTLRQRALYPLLEERDELLRPLNLSPEAPGHGSVILRAGELRVLVLNAMGQAFMEPHADSPFFALRAALRGARGEYDLSLLDLHAEATGEKFALASVFDGQIDIIFGTHTHVQTADEQLLPRGSAFITDIGMCGPRSSCLGIDPAVIAENLRTNLPQKFRVAGTPLLLQGILVLCEREGERVRVRKITRVSEGMS